MGWGGAPWWVGEPGRRRSGRWRRDDRSCGGCEERHRCLQPSSPDGRRSSRVAQLVWSGGSAERSLAVSDATRCPRCAAASGFGGVGGPGLVLARLDPRRRLVARGGGTVRRTNGRLLTLGRSVQSSPRVPRSRRIAYNRCARRLGRGRQGQDGHNMVAAL